MDVSQIVAVAVFVVVMITIMTEKLHRSLAAITGAMIVLALHVMPFDAAMEHIDFNTLGVLLGMMLFVSVVKLSGMFEFLAIKAARLEGILDRIDSDIKLIKGARAGVKLIGKG